MRLEELKSIKKNVENKLKELAERYKKSQTSKKGKKMTKESLIVQTYKILGRNKRLFNPDFENGLTYPINKNKWEYERKIAGKFLLVTDVDIEPNYAMKQYKQLQMVENAFDELKNFLSVRGIYHYKPRRVRAHVCISFFGLLMECIIEKFCSQTARVIIRKLGRIEVIKLDLKGKEKKILTKMTKETETIFDQLNIPKPLGLNY